MTKLMQKYFLLRKIKSYFHIMKIHVWIFDKIFNIFANILQNLFLVIFVEKGNQ